MSDIATGNSTCQTKITPDNLEKLFKLKLEVRIRNFEKQIYWYHIIREHVKCVLKEKRLFIKKKTKQDLTTPGLEINYVSWKITNIHESRLLFSYH